jgi:predicted GH43/DUF377 family glycosyl hydrolase
VNAGGSKKDKSLEIEKKKVIYELGSRVDYFDSGKIRTLGVFFIEDGVLVTYCTRAPFCLGVALFDKITNKLLYRTASAIFISKTPITRLKVKIRDEKLEFSFVRDGKAEKEAFSLNYILGKNTISPPKKRNAVTKKSIIEKSNCNPIIKPNPENSWESCGTFNAAVININGMIHILYRAVGNDGSSVIGYATSKDGINICERLPYPIYKPTGDFELRVNNASEPTFSYNSGGRPSCWGGCEDPRVVRIGNTIYMIYTAFNGVNPPCVAITSIKVFDFEDRKWEKWKKPALVSPKNQMNKNWIIFPEKIGGKYALLHSITPDIQIEYLDDLNFEKNPNIRSTYVQVRKKDAWDTVVRGVGPTPIKIDEGWLVFYHAINEREPGKYKIGAMILDYKNPTKILYRSNFPIIEPDKIYENEGYKGGIVYACGAILKDDDIILYYGGADTVVCAASCNLKKFIQQIKDDNGKV